MELDPENAEAHFQLATALSYTDEPAESDVHYEKANALRVAGAPPPRPDEEARYVLARSLSVPSRACTLT